MAENVTLNTPANLQNETTAIGVWSNNNTAITNALADTLSRTGVSPNTMQANLDMNSNRVVNLAAPVGNNDAARFVDLTNIVASSSLGTPLVLGGFGTIAAPAVTFINDTSTGIYHPSGAGKLGFTASNSLVLDYGFTTAGTWTFAKPFEVRVDQNAHTQVSITNASAGPAAACVVNCNNVIGAQMQFGLAGSGWQTYGAIVANSGYFYNSVYPVVIMADTVGGDVNAKIYFAAGGSSTTAKVSSSGTVATSTTTGAYTVSGGVGLTGALYTGSTVFAGSGISVGTTSDAGAGNILATGTIQTAGNTRVASDITFSSTTTLFNTTGLSVSLLGGSSYSFQSAIYGAIGSAGSGGLKIGVGGTCTATNLMADGYQIDGNVIQGRTQITSLSSAVGAFTTVSSTTPVFYVTGTVTVNTPGTLTIQSAQNSSGTTASTIKRGSWFKVWQET